MKRLCTAVAVALTPIAAIGAEATCDAYTHVTGADRSLFDGYIFGYVAAKLEGREDAVINEATRKVRNMTNAYCLQRPADRVSGVIATFAQVVLHSLEPGPTSSIRPTGHFTLSATGGVHPILQGATDLTAGTH